MQMQQVLDLSYTENSKTDGINYRITKNNKFYKSY